MKTTSILYNWSFTAQNGFGRTVVESQWNSCFERAVPAASLILRIIYVLLCNFDNRYLKYKSGIIIFLVCRLIKHSKKKIFFIIYPHISANLIIPLFNPYVDIAYPLICNKDLCSNCLSCAEHFTWSLFYKLPNVYLNND